MSPTGVKEAGLREGEALQSGGRQVQEIVTGQVGEEPWGVFDDGGSFGLAAQYFVLTFTAAEEAEGEEEKNCGGKSQVWEFHE